jgi:hypothetical protein
MPSDNYSGTSGDNAAEFKSAAADLGQKAGEKIDKGRSAAAGGIASAAESLHGHANDLPGGERVASLAHGAADKLSSTADYIRGHDLTAMFEDAKTLVKKNPVPALLGAAAIGFLLAKAFSRD